MNIVSLHGQLVVNSDVELSHALKKRFKSQFGTFILSFEICPYLLIAFNGTQAWLNYFVSEDHPGYLSQGSLPFEGKYVEFLDEDSAIELRPTSCVVSSEVAEKAALEFFYNQSLPNCVHWIEL
jgi:hypothetical protein